MASISASDYNSLLTDLAAQISNRFGTTVTKSKTETRGSKITPSDAYDTDLFEYQTLLKYTTKPIPSINTYSVVTGYLAYEDFIKAVGQIRDDFKYNHNCSDCIGVCNTACKSSCGAGCSDRCVSCRHDCGKAQGNCYGACVGGFLAACSDCSGQGTNAIAGCEGNCQSNCVQGCSTTCYTGCNSICSDNCSASCGSGCSAMARLGTMG